MQRCCLSCSCKEGAKKVEMCIGGGGRVDLGTMRGGVPQDVERDDGTTLTSCVKVLPKLI